ncbi:hypothetical protein [Aquibacillus kalidii]|uniref:hypothetical protein n=1 Tax=Aquibacillus kalidii TaxID=2762597 RepID=UPI00164882F2|nr:hypothetical protein [Aquibacillus kalidii]
MADEQSYNKFQYWFHTILIVIGIVFIVSTVIGFKQLDRPTMYIILGALIVINSLVRVIRVRFLRGSG